MFIYYILQYPYIVLRFNVGTLSDLPYEGKVGGSRGFSNPRVLNIKNVNLLKMAQAQYEKKKKKKVLIYLLT